MRYAGLIVTFGLAVIGCGGSSASASSSATPSASPAGTEERPAIPSRRDVMSAMTAVAPDVSTCLAAYVGRQVVVEFVLSSSGTVTETSVIPPDSPIAADGSPVSEVILDPTTLACVESAAAAARVPPFERETFLVRYPFRAR